ncbi:MAG: hypothetical protein GF329_09885 [Candidatus Lokiarchaeota archaeon]|nr:hypothetical protein [Candidatus Lokiarchaeota archaeon]
MVKYKVVISSQEFVFDDGIAVVRLMPRYDDYISELMSRVKMEEGQSGLKYKLILQITVEDDNYYGQNFVHTVDSVENFVGLIDAPCISSSSNLEIDSLQYNNTLGFDLLTDKLLQADVGVVDCYSNKSWVPYIENLTSSDVVSASSALTIINSIEEDDPLGGSPVYDSLIESCEFLSQDDYYLRNKTMFVFTDDEPNCSAYSPDEAAIEVNGLNEYRQVPLLIGNLNLYDTLALYSIYRGSNYQPYNILTSKTTGQAITISSENVIDDVVLMLIGEGMGSLGYGETDFVIDFGSLINLRGLVVNYYLYTNTGGRWRVSCSTDGYNYSAYSDYFDANENASFEVSICRYLKFNLELWSGLSTSNEEPYEDIPTGGVPRITSIDVYYADPKIDYIYLNPIYNVEIDQMVFSTNSNDVLSENKGINGGVAMGRWTHHWTDFEHNAQPARPECGRIVIPIRYDTVSGIRVEPLTSVDGYLFKATNGSWTPEATVIVLVIGENMSTASIVNSDKYTVDARNGYIIFKENRSRSGQHYINVYDYDAYRLGLKINNYDDNNLEIYGISDVYNEPE